MYKASRHAPPDGSPGPLEPRGTRRLVGYGDSFHTTVWTGDQMIIWGGFTQTGALYCAPPPIEILFADGFESGDTSAWSLVVGLVSL